LILGGTFSSYPREYTRDFIRDQFYAANTTYDKLNSIKLREKKSLYEEQLINQHESLVKIIGLTIETRPDQLIKDESTDKLPIINISDYTELQYLRYLGTTRIQIGIQHILNAILKKINRKCTHEQNIRSIKLAKEACFKVDIHIMLDLPGSSPETDIDMIDYIIESSDYQSDQWKLYPCETTPFTKIKEWYEAGLYKPYAETTNADGINTLNAILIYILPKIPPWVRLNRAGRDIPNEYHIGGIKDIAIHQTVSEILNKMGIKCRDIRSREIGSKKYDINDYNIIVRKYFASEGIEYFISWENDNEDLLGFCRLRINKSLINYEFPELNNCALLRELHIYGQLIHHLDDNIGEGAQHKGLGMKLVKKAIEIASIDHSISKLAVISGIGVKNYYINKLNFKEIETYIDADGNIQKALGHYLIRDLESKYYLLTIKNIYSIVFVIIWILFALLFLF